MIILARTLAIAIAICAIQVCSAQGQLHLTNDTDTALAFTLISKDQKTDRWLGPREITDINVSIDDDDRVLITRTGGKTSKDLLASPTEVLDLKAFRTDLAESGTIFAYVGGDPEDVADRVKDQGIGHRTSIWGGTTAARNPTTLPGAC